MNKFLLSILAGAVALPASALTIVKEGKAAATILVNAPIAEKGVVLKAKFYVKPEVSLKEYKGLKATKTVDEVTNYTKAGGACGKCKSIIQDVINTYYNKQEAEIDLANPNIGEVRFQGIIFDRDSRILTLGVQDKAGLKEYLDIKSHSRCSLECREFF